MRKPKVLRKKLASLSALGVGAVVAGAGKAEAAVIYYPNINQEVGFGAGAQDIYSSPVLGANSATFNFKRQSTSGNLGTNGTGHVFGRRVNGYGRSLGFATTSQFLQLVQAGANWLTGQHTSAFGRIGGRVWGSFTGGSFPGTFASPDGTGNFTDKYALFHFNSGPATLYGWIHLSFVVNPAYGTDSSLGPTLTVIDYAYDDTGAKLAAGALSQNSSPGTPTPEPSNLISSGIAALALGAAGVRRWRRSSRTA